MCALFGAFEAERNSPKVVRDGRCAALGLILLPVGWPFTGRWLWHLPGLLEIALAEHGGPRRIGVAVEDRAHPTHQTAAHLAQFRHVL